MQTISKGYVRIDFLGGTLDIDPICHILPETYTINAAVDLIAYASISTSDKTGLTLRSKNYDKVLFNTWNCLNEEDLFEKNIFAELTFIAALVNWFKQKGFINLNQGMVIDLNADAPAGSGLGGSSALGISVFKGLMKFLDVNLDKISILTIVKNIEAKILKSGPTGYQDYFPSLQGGILCLKACKDSVRSKQYYDKDFINYLSSRITLAYSNQSRLSGINNWEVIKNFFDDGGKTHESLREISYLSKKGEKALKNKNYSEFLDLVKEEGSLRANLFENIETIPVKNLKRDLQSQDKHIGLKMCGAGGGGCFIIIHESDQIEFVEDMITKHEMIKVPFQFIGPIVDS